MNIQWYPGHMTKSIRMMRENLSLVDVVIELLDARIPYSSRNPDIDSLAQNKYRIIVLNKSDLADAAVTNEWAEYFKVKGFAVVIADSIKGNGLNDVTEAARVLMREKVERLKAKGRIMVPTRAMIAGIPNVGKSTFINKYAGKAITKTGDKPGVTRGKQWVKIRNDFDLLDTPGILWPKFDDVNVGLKLAFTGAVSDEIPDKAELGVKLIELLADIKPEALRARYKIELDPKEPRTVHWGHGVLERIARARGFIVKNAEPDLERAAIVLLDEFRGCKLGRISLERPRSGKTEVVRL